MTRIRGVNPNLKQKRILQANGMDHESWLVLKVLPDRLECIHRITGAFKPAFYEVRRI
jgi:hypothetical protein